MADGSLRFLRLQAGLMAEQCPSGPCPFEREDIRELWRSIDQLRETMATHARELGEYQAHVRTLQSLLVGNGRGPLIARVQVLEADMTTRQVNDRDVSRAALTARVSLYGVVASWLLGGLGYLIFGHRG